MTCEVKFVQVHYTTTHVFMIPKDWNEDEFKEVDVRVISAAECSHKRPEDEEEVEDGEDYSSENYFDCEDNEQL